MLGSEYHSAEQVALPYGIADSAELEMLASVFNDYCAKHRVNAQDRETIALKVMCLFRRGIIDPDRISAELERVG